MKLIVTTFVILLITCVLPAQNDTIRKTYKDAEELKSQLNKDKLELLVYRDGNYGYKTAVPKWLTLLETGDKGIWGGTFPEIDGVKNAIMIKGFQKSEFKSFDHFKETYITGNKFGKQTLYSKNHVWYGHNLKNLKKIKHGVSCRVFTFYQNKIYHNQFVLLETKKAFLWIQFVATPDTYQLNLPKFDKFVSEIDILE